MGTNYYLHERNACPTCGHQPEPLHIGKSSAGWVFSLHVIPEHGIDDLPDWQARWAQPGARIVDEYGSEITPEEMLAKIVDRRTSARWTDLDLTQNGAIRGPNGLARSRCGPDMRCIGHGAGTYDLITGEFS